MKRVGVLDFFSCSTDEASPKKKPFISLFTKLATGITILGGRWYLRMH